MYTPCVSSKDSFHENKCLGSLLIGIINNELTIEKKKEKTSFFKCIDCKYTDEFFSANFLTMKMAWRGVVLYVC